MTVNADDNLLVGLDLGTSKVVAVVANVADPEQIEIVGIGSHPSTGMKKGSVVNIEETVYAIGKAVEEAELMAGCQIHSVYTGIVGSHIQSFNSRGMIAINGKQVTKKDVENVIEAAKTVVIPPEHKILHILPQEFMVDNQAGIADPIGMSGVRLEAKVHIVTGAISAAQNIASCVRRCGLEVDDMVLEQLASSSAVLTEDEKQLGVCLVDIGGGTSDIAIFKDGVICHTAVVPVAGDQVTSDLAVAFRTRGAEAEKIKLQHAVALHALHDPEHKVTVANASGEKSVEISQAHLAHVVEPRYEELFYLIKEELQKQDLLQSLVSGVVLTGGATKMSGVLDLAKQVFNLPVRQGLPTGVIGPSEVINNPIFATSIGLLLYGVKVQQQMAGKFKFTREVKGLINRLKGWLQGNF